MIHELWRSTLRIPSAHLPRPTNTYPSPAVWLSKTEKWSWKEKMWKLLDFTLERVPAWTQSKWCSWHLFDTRQRVTNECFILRLVPCSTFFLSSRREKRKKKKHGCFVSLLFVFFLIEGGAGVGGEQPFCLQKWQKVAACDKLTQQTDKLLTGVKQQAAVKCRSLTWHMKARTYTCASKDT